MNRKLAALILAIVAVLTIAGCSGSKAAPGAAAGTAPSAAPSASAPGSAGNASLADPGMASDPELQQLLQDDEKDQQQIDQLIQQIDKDLN